MRTNKSLSPNAAVRPNLRKLARDWATPIAADAKNVKAHARGNLSLTGQAAEYGRNWPTPTEADFKGSGDAGPNRRAGTTLTDAAVRQWPTPTTSDWKRGAQGDRPREGGPSLVTATNGHLGATTSPAGPDGRVLNPAFVEALMGLPGGWTDFGCSGTGSCGSRPPARCATCTSGRGAER